MPFELHALPKSKVVFYLVSIVYVLHLNLKLVNLYDHDFLQSLKYRMENTI